MMRSSAARMIMIADRLPLRTGDKRFAAAANRHALDFVGRQIVEELGPIRPGNLEPDAIRPVDKTGMSCDRFKFTGWSSSY